MGQRLIDGVAKSMAEDFFKRFDLAMQARYPEAYAVAAPAEAVAAPDSSEPATSRNALWAVLAAAVVLGVYLWMR